MEDEAKAPLKTTNVKVPIEKLRLDPNNVRFKHLAEKLTDKRMEDIIRQEKDTNSLYEQILAARGLYEQPIIDDNFVVIEGNRRIVCLRRLKEKANAGELPSIPKSHFDQVSCKQIPSGTPPLEKDLYLAAIQKPWPLFNRAKRISELHSDYNLSYDKLFKKLGMGKVTVIRLVNAYKQTERYNQRHPEDTEWYRKFTYFDELLKKRGLKDFSAKQENIDKFGDWVHEGKFSDHRDVRTLDHILKDPDARRIFENENLNAALKSLEEKDPTLKSKEFRHISKTILLLSSFPRTELIRTIKEPARRKMLEKLKEELDTLLRDIRALEPSGRE